MRMCSCLNVLHIVVSVYTYIYIPYVFCCLFVVRPYPAAVDRHEDEWINSPFTYSLLELNIFIYRKNKYTTRNNNNNNRKACSCSCTAYVPRSAQRLYGRKSIFIIMSPNACVPFFLVYYIFYFWFAILFWFCLPVCVHVQGTKAPQCSTWHYHFV